MRILNIYYRIKDIAVIKKILSNSMWLFIDKILRLLMGLIVGAWVARYLGPDNYGVLSYANAFVAIFASIATLGIDGLVVRELSKNNDEQYIEDILGTAFWIRVLGGCASVILSIATIFLLQPNNLEMILLISIISIGNIFQAFDTISLLFQAQVNSKRTVKVKFVAFIIVSILKVIAIVLNSTIIIFALLSVIEIIMGTIGLIFEYQKNILKFRMSHKLMCNFLKMSWPILLSMICIVIYTKADQILLATFMGEKILGVYSSATRLSEICYFIPNVIISSVTPFLVKSYVDDKVSYEKSTRKLFNYLVLISYGIAGVITLLAPWIIEVLYGKSYEGAEIVLRVHIWSLVFVSIGVGFRQLMIIENKMVFLLLTTILGALTNIVLNVWLIPLYSFYGAVVSLVLSQGIAGYMSTLLYPETRRLFYSQTRALFLIDFLKRT